MPRNKKSLSRPLVTVDPYVSLIGSLVLEANRISLHIRLKDFTRIQQNHLVTNSFQTRFCLRESECMCPWCFLLF